MSQEEKKEAEESRTVPIPADTFEQEEWLGRYKLDVLSRSIQTSEDHALLLSLFNTCVRMQQQAFVGCCTETLSPSEFNSLMWMVDGQAKRLQREADLRYQRNWDRLVKQPALDPQFAHLRADNWRNWHGQENKKEDLREGEGERGSRRQKGRGRKQRRNKRLQ